MISIRLALRPAVVLLAGLVVAGPSAGRAVAAGPTPDQVAKVLQSSLWFEDDGSFGGALVGRLFVFGPAEADGWYRGAYITYAGAAGSTTKGMAWKPLASGDSCGVLIDFANSRELVIFTGPAGPGLSVSITSDFRTFWFYTWVPVALPK